MQKSTMLKILKFVAVILLIPLIGTFTIEGWNWDVADFIIAGLMLFAVGIALDYIWKKISNPLHRIAMATAVVLAFMALWAELAVDAVTKALSTIL